ncbi:site-specific integrase [Erythrobacter sp. THAF29]|uniref:tyrosine-type recombinase/integrase n=1 Tax=Erythrobacter sp. THAF29 TaxID=2587851 RepID=UPI0012688408|nr:site-specific integrase [Erythrobacter sp. THAF29]QFT76015.1 site-specific tyrosine recombinase XerC [Erythrobacter sp. THAF29]
MKGQPARVLERSDLDRLLLHCITKRHKLRDQAIVLLSFKAGLRACEIAGLTWQMALRSDNKVGSQLTLSGGIAKYGSGRIIPLHRDLRRALKRLHKEQGNPPIGPVVPSERGGHMTPRGIVNWFGFAYRELGLVGCSSHSGRRTFITQSARLVSKFGGSLRDVQELAGHRALTTTERYIQGDRDAQRTLIGML